MNAVKTMWQVLWCVPVALLWMAMYAALWLGFGAAEADAFIYYWTDMVHRHEVKKPPTKPDESGGVQRAADGPDYEDGCSKEGFIGGCERMGCHRVDGEAG